MKAVLCAALYPNAAVMDEAAGRSARPAWNDGTADVHIHPSSINHPLEAHQFLRPYLVYLEKVCCWQHEAFFFTKTTTQSFWLSTCASFPRWMAQR